MNVPGDLQNQAVRLMQFLSRLQELKEAPLRTVDAYKDKKGIVRWLSDIPQHSAITLRESVEPGQNFLIVTRAQDIAPPQIPEELKGLISGSVDDPKKKPKLVWPGEKIQEVDNIYDPELRELYEETFKKWLPRWESWAEQRVRDDKARAFYNGLFELRQEAEKQSEQLELILGLGLLTWTPEDHDPVQRHLYTVPLAVELDGKTGALSVTLAEGAFELRTELDMLSPSIFGSKDLPEEIRAAAGELDPLVIDAKSIASIGRPAVHALASDGQYSEAMVAPRQSSAPNLSYAPALILRPRSSKGLSQIYATIAEEILETGKIPAALKPLVNPNLEPPAQVESKPGALVKIGEDIFSPLPLNDSQKKIIEKVDTTAQTLVQGPPGTGKTHTAAALLTHLLAQGKRVLVTAKTDRALYEVRDKLPEPIKPLAVSVIGTGRNDMAELTGAIDEIARTADEFDSAANQKAITAELKKIEQLKKQRQSLIQDLVELRSAESRQQEVSGYLGSRAVLIRAYKADSERYSWVDGYVDPGKKLPGGFTADKAMQWLSWQRDAELRQDAPAALKDDPATLGLPAPLSIRKAIGESDRISAGMMADASSSVITLSENFTSLTEGEREELKSHISTAQQARQGITDSPQPWVHQLFEEMQVSGVDSWTARLNRLLESLDELQKRADEIGQLPSIHVEGDPSSFLGQADIILTHVEKNGPLKVKPNGEIKMGMFTPSAVKGCKPFLDSVKVGGRPVSTAEDIKIFIQNTTVGLEIQKWEDEWSSALSRGIDSSLEGRLSRLHALLNHLRMILSAAEVTDALQRKIMSLSAPAVAWMEPTGPNDYIAALDLAAQKNQLAEARQSIEEALDLLGALEYRLPEAYWIPELTRALQTDDAARYEKAYQEGLRLSESYKRITEMTAFSDSLRTISPRLVQEIEADPEKPIWDERLSALKDAIAWQKLGMRIDGYEDANVNAIQQRINQIEQRIRTASAELAKWRAWGAAVGPGRLSTASRASLTNYVQQVRKLGKGTGKYAARQRAVVQRALDECRTAVPVWIMPISSIVDQLNVKENLFDVVLVDEASQAGMEASFLQYLAPKIVVIGDDKQVSPAAVGINQQQIIDLEQQYLEGIKFADSWADPTKSLFDDASLRFGGKITLTEHRRCVPEIINFSNRIAYEPEKIRLEPVRQVGVDRLAPFKIVRTRHGFQQGRGSSLPNPVEADAVVAQIKKCLKDPAYDGLTFGVISLLGSDQAKLIQGKLLESVDAVEAEKRQLMVGIAADFQGAERDVMFLSMVSAYDPDKRTGALTKDINIQRFNVAVSRAKDQVWLFHSIGLDHLNNKEDMRYQLLDYAYGIVRQGRTLPGVPSLVSDTERMDPFDSLFEQRVFNQIASRGFAVVPQEKALGYSLDLVIHGENGKIAVECDGDHWHGPAQYERDLARQRDLERCGWEFFRIRETEYYMDPYSALNGLWKLLEEREITPSDWVNDEMGPEENIIILDGSEEDLQPEVVSKSLLEEVVEPSTPPVQDEPTVTAVVNREPVRPISNVQPALMEKHEVYEEDDLFTNREIWKSGENPGDAEPEEQTIEIEVYDYEEFSGRTIPAKDASNQQIVEGLVKILETEGPMLGGALVQSYHRASGGTRISSEIRALVNRAISSAKRKELVIEENPLAVVGQKDRTYLLSDQSSEYIRELGPRGLDQVPPLELLTLLEQLVDVDFSDEEMMRTLLEFYGFTKLTAHARRVLEPIVELYRNHS